MGCGQNWGLMRVVLSKCLCQQNWGGTISVDALRIYTMHFALWDSPPTHRPPTTTTHTVLRCVESTRAAQNSVAERYRKNGLTNVVSQRYIASAPYKYHPRRHDTNAITPSPDSIHISAHICASDRVTCVTRLPD